VNPSLSAHISGKTWPSQQTPLETLAYAINHAGSAVFSLSRVDGQHLTDKGRSQLELHLGDAASALATSAVRLGYASDLGAILERVGEEQEHSATFLEHLDDSALREDTELGFATRQLSSLVMSTGKAVAMLAKGKSAETHVMAALQRAVETYEKLLGSTSK
jgi:hypothetical protein